MNYCFKFRSGHVFERSSFCISRVARYLQIPSACSSFHFLHCYCCALYNFLLNNAKFTSWCKSDSSGPKFWKNFDPNFFVWKKIPFRVGLLKAFSSHWYNHVRGPCYNHNFLPFSNISGENFLKNKCYDQIFA
jgi:hypothetical protein